MKLQSDLREFIALLNSHAVDFVVVGGYAVGYHGFPRFTGDIDLFLRPTAENSTRVVAVLRAFGFADVAGVDETLVQPGKVVQLGRPPNRIDLLTGISAVDFEEAIKGSEIADLDGLPVRIIGRAALLKNKRATGRTKDLADVEELEKLPGGAA